MPPTSFTSASRFTLPDEILRKLRGTSFLTGREPGPEFTRAAIAGALDVGARKESEQVRLSQQFALQEERLGLERENIARLSRFQEQQIGFQEEQAESAQKTALFSGAGQLAGLALFAPIFSGTTGKPTTAAGKIFKFFFP